MTIGFCRIVGVGKVLPFWPAIVRFPGLSEGIFPANVIQAARISTSASVSKCSFVHGDELQMASVARKPQIADTAHAVPALHRGEGALDG